MNDPNGKSIQRQTPVLKIQSRIFEELSAPLIDFPRLMGLKKNPPHEQNYQIR